MDKIELIESNKSNKNNKNNPPLSNGLVPQERGGLFCLQGKSWPKRPAIPFLRSALVQHS